MRGSGTIIYLMGKEESYSKMVIPSKEDSFKENALGKGPTYGQVEFIRNIKAFSNKIVLVKKERFL